MRITAGQEPMKNKLIRIGHMGHYTDADILDVVAAGARLPRKSTFFWPKPRTGMVIRPHDLA